MVGEVQLNAETPGKVPAGARISAGKSGSVEVVTEGRCLSGESVTSQLHAIAAVPGKSNDYPVQLNSLFGHA